MSKPDLADLPPDQIWDETLAIAAEIRDRRPLAPLGPPRPLRGDAVAAFLLSPAAARLDPPGLVAAVGEHLLAEGLPMRRVTSGLLAMHPQIFARTFVWDRVEGMADLARGFEIEQSEFYRASPVRLIHLGAPGFRRRLEGPAAADDFPVLADLRAAGATDYLIRPLDFAAVRRSFVAFATDRPGGFSDGEIARLDDLVPILSLRFETAMQRQLLDTLLSLYLGQDAARRVATGAVRRGDGETIRAAIMTCDMRGFTRLTDRASASEVIALLDAYLDAVTLAVHGEGGEVLKFMGDGCLAIFPADEGTGTGTAGRDACRRALAAACAALTAIDGIENLPPALGPSGLKVGFALNFGDVVYGNIGSTERLDFTVIGPAVNEVARIEALCKVLDRKLLTTSTFADELDLPDALRSVGLHVLRGRREPTEIYTTDED
ncbi:adenylate/guanylate cyclase domain-containing protein [Zavarzinia aquatilis]|uniref:Adenylate/guanylate cyclase domain-containing protein n=1 Tax=Zavarzinia aquatilis TaxID=2211142 RepID=A0A317DZU1_9PROT|nr:adenylate/guanylate cyclase domain-containing protein [Zavarzinia aquatilis]PWR20239.1 adenylate/guanylate cyclase domain-containing protein [Zavarzinia aquatilis]